MNWTSFWQSVAEATVSAALWAGAAWLFYFIRHKWIEKQLRFLFSWMGTSQTGQDAFGISLENKSDFSVIVRDVVLLNADKSDGFQLPFTSPSTAYLFTERKSKKPMSVKLNSVVRPKEPEVTPHGFIELPTKTGGDWTLPKRIFAEHADIIPTKARLVIEYRTLLGSTKLLIVESNTPCSKHIAESFMKFIGKAKGGEPQI